MKLLLLLSLLSASLFAQGPNTSDQWKYSNESNLSIIQTGGNSNIETYDLKTENTFKKNKDEFNVGGHYILGEAESTENGQKVRNTTARNWDIHAKYNRKISKAFGGYISIKIEADEFAGYERRSNYDIGSRYTLIDKDEFESYLEAGLRYTDEIPVKEAEDESFADNKGRLYYYVMSKPDKQVSYKFWIEYIPNFTRPDDYLITTAPSVTTTLSDIFSLQVAYKIAYDNEPAVAGNEYTDYTFTTALVVQF